MYDDDRDALAAEYVLGTLSADEREQAEALLAIDPAFAEIVRVWERRLGELNVMVEAVEPPAEVWDKVKAEVGGPEAEAHEAHLNSDEEFSFPPLEEVSPQTAPELSVAKPPETAAAETPPAPEPHEEPERSEEEQGEPEARNLPDPDESLDDLLAAPLPEMPRDLDEPSEHLTSSLLPPEPEAETEPAPAQPPAQQSDQVEDLDFESDLKAVVLHDLGRDGSSKDDLNKEGFGEESNRGPAPEPFTPLTPPSVERGADVIVLERRARSWRRMTAAMTAIAALLALYVGVSQFAPGLIPVSKQKPPTVTAQVVTPPSSRLVAVLQQDPTTPAFLVSVDPTSRMLTVRRVSAATEPGHSYELWLISNKYPAPRSLGLVGISEFTARPLPQGLDADAVKTASYAVSLEPVGGSPTGAPTGPILFKGRMVEALPGSAG